MRIVFCLNLLTLSSKYVKFDVWNDLVSCVQAISYCLTGAWEIGPPPQFDEPLS